MQTTVFIQTAVIGCLAFLVGMAVGTAGEGQKWTMMRAGDSAFIYRINTVTGETFLCNGQGCMAIEETGSVVPANDLPTAQ